MIDLHCLDENVLQFCTPSAHSELQPIEINQILSIYIAPIDSSLQNARHTLTADRSMMMSVGRPLT